MVLMVDDTLHSSWLTIPYIHSTHECKSVRSKVVSIDGRFDRQKSIRSKTSISSIEDWNYCLSLN